ncbi:AraC family transcriptional regulator [Nannocystis punicea]|uniref:AraC family transcriptional regulator n=1 Tax=Nannocystis punicea TaxID=2995304 RepID=A0ABY7H9A7_9BACT|nr:AraC family transcriptional regulator [Nannocystis poenicansa]WAS95821.1 AraC family transcriptional regulator [Nannocystis poenicansa]
MHGKSPVVEGIRSIRAARRMWSGVEVAATDYYSVDEGRVMVELTGPRHRLAVLLQQVGGFCEARTAPRRPGVPRNPGARYLASTPGGMPIWGYSDRISYTHELTLLFDPAELSDRLGEVLRDDIDLAPRPWLSNERIFALSELLAAEVTGGGEFGQLYGESLVLALLVEYLRAVRVRAPASRKGGLTPRQLREVCTYMQEHLSAPVGLRELAALGGMSQAHFSRAFKASTGVPPHRWQLNARVERAQQLLLGAEVPLADIALRLGFVDQSHLTRVFRRVVGTTPSAWRRAHARRGR